MTKDAKYLIIIFFLVLFIGLEFTYFTMHYDYLVEVLKLVHKFKTHVLTNGR